MLVVLLSFLALAASAQSPEEDEWIDPYDMLNYDATTKTMRKPAEPSNYPNVPTKRRGLTEDTKQLSECSQQLDHLQQQNEDQQKRITQLSQQPTCNPVFKRFLSRLLKEIERVGLPTDSTDMLYDAQIKVSKQTLSEIRGLVDGEDSWRTGALDNAISHILTDLRPHDYEAWKWRFEDTFGVDLDTIFKSALCVLVIVIIISTELWSTISWFVQFRRLFAVCFMISIVWNWFYLYKIAFAEHQNSLAKMDGVDQKCTGVKKIDWSDSLKEWFRSTWTLQDDPCKRYYEVLMVNPILLVPPTKAFSVTVTTFITEPLKHFGQGISEFLRALLKDLPVQLQIPVLLTIVLSILVVMYGGVHAAFQHGITAPFHRRRDPHDQLEPPPERHALPIDGGRGGGGGDAPFYAPPPQLNQGHQDRGGDRGGNQVRQRDVKRDQEQRKMITVQTLGNMNHGTDMMDANVNEAHSDSELLAAGESEPEVNTEQAEKKPSEAKTKETLNKKPSGACREGAEARTQPNTAETENSSMIEPPQMKRDVRKEDATENDQNVRRIETIGHPVQETSPEDAP